MIRATLLLLALALAACGIKGDPVPPQEAQEAQAAEQAP